MVFWVSFSMSMTPDVAGFDATLARPALVVVVMAWAGEFLAWADCGVECLVGPPSKSTTSGWVLLAEAVTNLRVGWPLVVTWTSFLPLGTPIGGVLGIGALIGLGVVLPAFENDVQVVPLTHFFLFLPFCKNSLICLDGKFNYALSGMMLVSISFSFVPPSNYLVSVLDLWRAFWADTAHFKGPQFCLMRCLGNYRDTKTLSSVLL